MHARALRRHPDRLGTVPPARIAGITLVAGLEVAELRIVQAPVGEVLAPVRPPQRARPEPLTNEVAGVADAGLRDALARLGAGIRAGR